MIESWACIELDPMTGGGFMVIATDDVLCCNKTKRGKIPY